MNAFELGFFSELEKLATVEDGTLSFPKKKFLTDFRVKEPAAITLRISTRPTKTVE
jgi:hypothetical protein